MADSNDRSSLFAKYDKMSTEELQQILRDDASKSEGHESDMDELFYVMDVLANRRNEKKEGKTPEEALESFKQNYYPEITDDSSPFLAKTFAFHKRSLGYWKRGLVTAAAMLVFVISCTLTADALGFDLWDTVAKWTQETFHFGYAGQAEETNAPTPDFSYPCTSLQESLDLYNVTARLVPMWIPDGYEECAVDVLQTPTQRQFIAAYQCGEDYIRILITDYLDTHPVQIEQSENLVDIHSINGIDFYIFENDGHHIAAWTLDAYECYISGPISVDQIKEMINSIMKG